MLLANTTAEHAAACIDRIAPLLGSHHLLPISDVEAARRQI